MKYFLLLKTDSALSQISIYKGSEELIKYEWHADSQLAEKILKEINNLLKKENLIFNDLGGIGIYTGPGSFTGLRIGISTANSLANGLNIPVSGNNGSNWENLCLDQLNLGKNSNIITPVYGSEVKTTKAKK